MAPLTTPVSAADPVSTKTMSGKATKAARELTSMMTAAEKSVTVGREEDMNSSSAENGTESRRSFCPLRHSM